MKPPPIKDFSKYELHVDLSKGQDSTALAFYRMGKSQGKVRMVYLNFLHKYTKDMPWWKRWYYRWKFDWK